MEKTKFKAYCEEHGYTSRYIAEVIGVSQSSVFKYLQGVRSPSRKIMKKMRESLDDFSYELFI